MKRWTWNSSQRPAESLHTHLSEVRLAAVSRSRCSISARTDCAFPHLNRERKLVRHSIRMIAKRSSLCHLAISMNAFPGAEPARSVDHALPPAGVRCPECRAPSPTIAALSSHFVSLHCILCGEVWLLRERRPWLADRIDQREPQEAAPR